MNKFKNLTLAIIIFPIFITAQIGIIDDIIDVPIENVQLLIGLDPLDDAKTVVESYIEPLGKSIGTGLNAGWYNTGKPHRFPGFDITFGGHIISLPSESKSFTTNILPPDFSEEQPTINGGEGDWILSGGDWNTFYMPYVQGSIGLIHKTELLFRYMPPISYSNLNANYWGLGIKHDFKQYVPIIGKLPFDVSFLAAYSSLKSNYEYEWITPDGFSSGDLPDLPHPKNLDFDVQAFNCNVILSKKLAFITAYAGAGYQHSTSNLTFNGDWMYTNESETYMTDTPLNLSLGGVNGFKTNIGARLKFLLFTVHADYTVAEYNIFTIGIGLNSDLGSRIIGGTIEKATKKDKKKKKEKEGQEEN